MSNRNPFRALVDCDIPQAEYRASKRGLLDFLQRAGQQGGFDVLSLEPALCDGESCRTMLGDVVVYRDEGHLSHAGSVAESITDISLAQVPNRRAGRPRVSPTAVGAPPPSPLACPLACPT